MRSTLFTALLGGVGVFSALTLAAAATPGNIYRLEKRTPVLEGDAVPIAPGTYPRTTRLHDGSILACYTSFADKDTTHILQTSLSNDNGTSWTALGEITRGTGDIDNCNPIQLSSGRVLASFRNHDADKFRLTVCASDDGGRSWQFLSQIAEEDRSSPYGLWEPFFRIVDAQPASAPETLQVYYSRENAKTDQDNLMRNSTNGGQNWGAPVTVSGGDVEGARDGMTGVARFGNKLVCVFETTEGGNFKIKAVTSDDNGKTWGNRQTVYLPSGTDNNAGAPQIAVASNTLVVTFMTDEDTSLHDWTNGAAVKFVYATELGQWEGPVKVGDVQSNWAGVMQLDQTHVLAVFDHGGNKAQKIRV